MKGMPDSKWLYRLYDLWVYMFFFSFIFALRPILGFATIMLAATSIVLYKRETSRWWNPGYFNIFNIGLILYFILQAIALLHTRNQIKGMEVFQTNLGMLVLPVGVLYSDVINAKKYRTWMSGYVIILFAAMVVCLAKAAGNYSQTHDSSVFFYHSLVAIYSNHAIQFSVIVFIGIQFLLDQYQGLNRRLFKTGVILLILFFSFFLFLLSSKLVILFYLVSVIRCHLYENVYCPKAISNSRILHGFSRTTGHISCPVSHPYTNKTGMECSVFGYTPG